MMKGMGAFYVKASLYCLSKAPKQSFAKKRYTEENVKYQMNAVVR